MFIKTETRGSLIRPVLIPVYVAAESKFSGMNNDAHALEVSYHCGEGLFVVGKVRLASLEFV